MFYEEILKGGLLITLMRAVHAEQLEQLQRKVFPALADDELLHAEQYRKHLEIFPEGQFVALNGELVVGATTTMRYHFNKRQPEQHTVKQVMGERWLTMHYYDGQWL